MKVRVASISFLVAVLFLPAIALGQEQRNDIPAERKSIDWFYIDADYRPKTLLLKLLQFTAPYPGYYHRTAISQVGQYSRPDFTVLCLRRMSVLAHVFLARKST